MSSGALTKIAGHQGLHSKQQAVSDLLRSLCHIPNVAEAEGGERKTEMFSLKIKNQRQLRYATSNGEKWVG